MNSIKSKFFISRELMDKINFIATAAMVVILVAVGVPFIGFNLWRSF